MKTNIERLQEVAEGLDELNEKVVYVGGSVSQLYVNDEAAEEARPTMDVDCVVELYSHQEYEEFNELLRKKKFEEDREKGAPICRWLYKGEMVDVMPTDEKFLGFTNKWYQPGIQRKVDYTLPNGRVIRTRSSSPARHPTTAFAATNQQFIVSVYHSRTGTYPRTPVLVLP